MVDHLLLPESKGLVEMKELIALPLTGLPVLVVKLVICLLGHPKKMILMCFFVVVCFQGFSEYVGLINTKQGCQVEPAITKCDKTLIDPIAAATVHFKNPPTYTANKPKGH